MIGIKEDTLMINVEPIYYNIWRDTFAYRAPPLRI